MLKIFKIDLNTKRNFGLDLLRFIAISTVLISHSIILLPKKFHIIDHVIFDGVLVFFVLSGFLIGRIFIKDFENDISLASILIFWKRRWLRTLPAYFFTIFIIIALSLAFGRYLNKILIIKSLFFVQYLTYRYGNFFPESWSLSIEEWFYLTLPLSILLFSLIFRINFKLNIIITAISIIVVSLLIRYLISVNTVIDTINEWDNRLRCPVVTRLDSIMMGVVGAWFYQYKKLQFVKYKNVLFFLGALIFLLNKLLYSFEVITFNGIYSKVLYFTVLPFSILLMLPFIYYLNPVKNRFFYCLITKGSLISYSLYLLNLTVISSLLLIPLEINYWYKFFLFWFLSIVFAFLMYKYIELPFMKLRDKKMIQ
jgi:peptidoglycan/LPS O-acetylase OafA/YrhL